MMRLLPLESESEFAPELNLGSIASLKSEF